MIEGKCPNCGSILKVDNSKDAAICEFCGTPFIVEKAVSNYSFTADVINVYEAAPQDIVIRAGVLEKYNGALTEVVIPDTVTVIGPAAFKDCLGLKKVIFPDGLKSIEQRAFSNCTQLESASLPHALTKIGDGAFEMCASLSSVSIDSATIHAGAFRGCKNLTEVDFGSEKVEIGEYSFAGTSLNRIIVPAGSTVGAYAFQKCRKLKNIVFDGNVKIYTNAFEEAPVSDIMIPDGSLINGEAFIRCIELERAEIGNNVKMRGDVFRGCTKLDTVTWLDGENKIMSKGYEYLSEIFAGSAYYDKISSAREHWKLTLHCQYCGGEIKFFSKACKNCGRIKDY